MRSLFIDDDDLPVFISFFTRRTTEILFCGNGKKGGFSFLCFDEAAKRRFFSYSIIFIRFVLCS